MGEGHGFVHTKHETLRLLKWKRKHLELHHGKQSIPHHGNNKEGGFL
jgi:hypothetical protein